ncbi:hypothetical protein ACLOJK_002993 [Asimina triloba]
MGQTNLEARQVASVEEANEFARPSHALPTISEDYTTLEESETEYEKEQQIKRDPRPQYSDDVLKTRGNRQNLTAGKTFNPDRQDVEHSISLCTTSESETEYEKEQRSRGTLGVVTMKNLMAGKTFNPDMRNVEHSKSLYTTLEEYESEYEEKLQIKRNSQYVLKTRDERKNLMGGKPFNPDGRNDEHSKSLFTMSEEKPQIKRNTQYVLNTRGRRKKLRQNIPADFVREHLPKSSQLIEVRNAAGIE